MRRFGADLWSGLALGGLGAYIIVADAYPQPGNRTRMQLYGPSIGYDVVYRAIRGWASGENLGCPDLTKIGK